MTQRRNTDTADTLTFSGSLGDGVYAVITGRPAPGVVEAMIFDGVCPIEEGRFQKATDGRFRPLEPEGTWPPGWHWAECDLQQWLEEPRRARAESLALAAAKALGLERPADLSAAIADLRAYGDRDLERWLDQPYRARLRAVLKAVEDEDAAAPDSALSVRDDGAVEDSAGGVWVPSAEARDEIVRSGYPECHALFLCARQSSRGEWHD